MQYYHDLHHLRGIRSESRHSPCSDQYADTWEFWPQSTLKCEIVHMCTFVYIHTLKGTKNTQDTMGNDKFHSLTVVYVQAILCQMCILVLFDSLFHTAGDDAITQTLEATFYTLQVFV